MGDAGTATNKEIIQGFTDQGFEHIGGVTFYRPSDNSLITDAKPANISKVGDDIIPFDVTVTHPDQKTVAGLESAKKEFLDME